MLNTSLEQVFVFNGIGGAVLYSMLARSKCVNCSIERKVPITTIRFQHFLGIFLEVGALVSLNLHGLELHAIRDVPHLEDKFLYTFLSRQTLSQGNSTTLLPQRIVRF